MSEKEKNSQPQDNGEQVDDKKEMEMVFPKKTDTDREKLVFIDSVTAWMPEEVVNDAGTVHMVPGGVVLNFRWFIKGKGFGEYRVRIDTEGAVTVLDDETLGLEFFRELLTEIADRAVLAPSRAQQEAEDEAAFAALRGKKPN